MVRNELFRLTGTLERDPTIEAWFDAHPGPLGSIAHHWFTLLRGSGDEVRELLHDGCPVVCLGEVAFAYVNVFTAHVHVGFYQGAALPDPTGLLQGAGKFMRHVRLKPAAPANHASLEHLIEAAYADVKARIENG